MFNYYTPIKLVKKKKELLCFLAYKCSICIELYHV